MNRTTRRAGAVLGALTCALALSTSAVPSVSASASGRTGTDCFDPTTVDAAARGATNPRAHDTREITATQQAAIEARTKKILAAKNAGAAKGKPGGGGGGGTGTGGPLNNIPVYVHVMTSTSGAGDVTDALADQEGRGDEHPGEQKATNHGGPALLDRLVIPGIERELLARVVVRYSAFT